MQCVSDEGDAVNHDLVPGEWPSCLASLLILRLMTCLAHMPVALQVYFQGGHGLFWCVCGKKREEEEGGLGVRRLV